MILRKLTFLNAVALLGCLAATPSLAELNDRQQAAFDAILPALATSLEEQGGEAMGALAPMLATCIVTEAKRREVRALADGGASGIDTGLLNDLMGRPDVQGCVAKAVNQG
ncbi:MAG: hypothetical protein AAGI10_13565 [Pseudomonadota bacterium]